MAGSKASIHPFDPGRQERIGAVARAHRATSGLSMRAVADATGRSSTSIYRFEKGESLPKRLEDFVRDYAAAVGTTEETIWREALGVEPEVVEVSSLVYSTALRGITTAFLTLALPLAIGAVVLGLVTDAWTEAGLCETLVEIIGLCAAALYVLPHLVGVGPWAKIGVVVFTGALAAEQIYTLARALSVGDYAAADPIVFALRGVVALGMWLVLYGLIRARGEPRVPIG